MIGALPTNPPRRSSPNVPSSAGVRLRPPRNACRGPAEPQRPGAAANHGKGRGCGFACAADSCWGSGPLVGHSCGGLVVKLYASTYAAGTSAEVTPKGYCRWPLGSRPARSQCRRLDRFAASKCESMDAIVSADEKAFRCGNQGLEMSKPSERCAWRCDEQLSRIAAKTVEAIVAFRTEYPDNWIGAAIRRCRDR